MPLVPRPPSPHLGPERLVAEALEAWEEGHLASCFRCRSERRIRRLDPPSVRWLGPYEVLGEAGSGGMGRVYAVRHRPLGVKRAIKLLTLETKGARERFAREARAQQRVDHDNVLGLVEVLDLPEGPALVLPWVEGPSLAGLLAARPLSTAEALPLFRALVAGVAAIHAAGLVHRDLKPDNVLLDTSGSELGVRVADFGLAKTLADSADDALTRSGVLLGTPAYMAPEQRLDPRRVDPRADVWALGVILCEMLDGQRPPASGPPPIPSELPPDWQDVARSALRLDPNDRPADATVLLGRLPETGAAGDALLERCRELTPVPAVVFASDVREVSAGALPTGRLPPEQDLFVGRRQEIAKLARLMVDERLVSVLGTPGVGKTRLALQYARVWFDEHPGGVWFCDLSEARDLDGVLQAVARSLEVPLGPGDPVLQLGHAIAARGRCLLVLDNFEQVAGHAEATLGRWLARAGDARFLVTSRERLQLPGEAELEVPLMDHADACELFLWRAGAARRGFRSTEADRAAIERLVVLLDYLPLAIELAAARVTVMAPAEMVERMGERFRLLASPGRRDRHGNLRAALDWSWELLSPDEQDALAQLSVFEGGFTLAAAEAVLRLGETWPVDAVQELVHRSLVRAVGEGRFDLLDTVRVYARERLVERGGAEEAERRHGQHFARLGSPVVLEEIREGSTSRWSAASTELDNLVAASQRATARGEAEVSAGAALAAAEGDPTAVSVALERVSASVSKDGTEVGALVARARAGLR